MSDLRSCIPNLTKRALIGMVHVQALPGTPHNALSIEAICRQALADADVLAGAGFDALLIENMHDLPYLMTEVGPEVTASMTAVGCAIRKAIDLPLGVQILAGANRQALAVAQACGACFVRAEGFVFAHVADEGLMALADAGPLLRYRRLIGAEGIAVLADIKKKHSSHALTADLDLAQTAHAAEFFGAGGVIVTGNVTGQPADPTDVAAARQAVDVPVLIGSGITADNLADYWSKADAFIVGSAIKKDGLWSNPPDRARAEHLVQAARQLNAT